MPKCRVGDVIAVKKIESSKGERWGETMENFNEIFKKLDFY